MTLDTVLLLASAATAYAVGAVTVFELPGGKRVAAVAAFGPPLISLGPQGAGVASLPSMLAIAIAAELVATAVARRGFALIGWHAIMLVGAGGMWAFASDALGRVGFGARSTVLLAVLATTLMYPVADWAVRPVLDTRARRFGRFVTEVPASLRVHALLVSCSLLLVMSYDVLGWPAFLVLVAPLVAIRREFALFGAARETYDQTVRALAALSEQRGIVPAGHQARVAALCSAVAEEVGLSSERARLLVQFASLHDVGAVSLPDESSHGENAADLAAASAAVLRETDIAAFAAEIFDGESRTCSVEHEIFRIAHAFESCARTGQPNPVASAIALAPCSSAVCDALSRVVDRIALPAVFAT